MKFMMDGAVITDRVAEGLDSLQMDAGSTLDVIDHAMRMIVAGGMGDPDKYQETVNMLRDLVILRSDLELVCGYNDPDFNTDDYNDPLMRDEDEEEDIDDEEEDIDDEEEDIDDEEEDNPEPEQSETGSEPDTEPESGD